MNFKNEKFCSFMALLIVGGEVGQAVCDKNLHIDPHPHQLQSVSFNSSDLTYTVREDTSGSTIIA